MKCSYITAVLLSVLLCLHNASAEVFTSMADMEELLDIEAVLVANVEAYISLQEDILQSLKSRVNMYHKEHSVAYPDSAAYLSVPMNAYLLVKRLTRDWPTIEKAMALNVSAPYLEFMTEIRNYESKYPTDEDLNGAAVALTRLQDVYQLDTSSIARGEIHGVRYSSEMSANDCFELGRQSYLNDDFYHTALWMQEAIDQLANAADPTLTSKAECLEFLAFSRYKQDNLETALRVTNELLELQPDHERASFNKMYYEDELRNPTTQQSEENVDGDGGTAAQATTTNPHTSSYFDSAQDLKMYAKLCRNEVQQSPAALAKLSCRFVHGKSAFLKIAPLKLEEFNLRPYIVVYYDVLSDTEIEYMKHVSRPKFYRATTTADGGKPSVLRIGKVAWINEDHQIVSRISRRVEDMTGLTTFLGEDLQVVNYGIGGHYVPHNDVKNIYGDRIATVLFYMNDVQQGGSTVFPKLNVTLQARKGTAALWYNMHPSGEIDYRTLHAGCPVLIGSKWIVTKWLNELPQMFLRPCNPYPQETFNELY